MAYTLEKGTKETSRYENMFLDLCSNYVNGVLNAIIQNAKIRFFNDFVRCYTGKHSTWQMFSILPRFHEIGECIIFYLNFTLCYFTTVLSTANFWNIFIFFPSKYISFLFDDFTRTFVCSSKIGKYLRMSSTKLEVSATKSEKDFGQLYRKSIYRLVLRTCMFQRNESIQDRYVTKYFLENCFALSGRGYRDFFS